MNTHKQVMQNSTYINGLSHASIQFNKLSLSPYKILCPLLSARGISKKGQDRNLTFKEVRQSGKMLKYIHGIIKTLTKKKKS